MEYEFEHYDEFELLTKVMIFVKEAADAGGSIDVYTCPSGAFIEEYVEGSMYFEKYLPIWGIVDEDPDPLRADYDSDEAWDKAVRNHKCIFTLNENGWKLAEQIKQLRACVKSIAPTQAQINLWLSMYLQDYKRATFQI